MIALPQKKRKKNILLPLLAFFYLLFPFLRTHLKNSNHTRFKSDANKQTLERAQREERGPSDLVRISRLWICLFIVKIVHFNRDKNGTLLLPRTTTRTTTSLFGCAHQSSSFFSSSSSSCSEDDDEDDDDVRTRRNSNGSSAPVFDIIVEL
jgi:hypothetical protein